MHLLLIFLVFLLGCTAQKPLRYVPRPELTIHADTAFTPEEREVIQSASMELVSQIGVRVDVIYDLDLRKPERTFRLVRVLSVNPATAEMDKFFQAEVYGWTHPFIVPRAYIVVDRLESEGFARHVVLHELLHVLGCQHVDDPSAVLYGITNRQHMAVVLTEADRAELLRTQPEGFIR